MYRNIVGVAQGLLDMATVVDLLRKLGKRASGESAFAGPVVLPGAPAGAGAADAANLAQAGTHSSVALLGHGAPVHSFLAATVATRLRAAPLSTALWIVPENETSTAAIRSTAHEAGIAVQYAGSGASRIGPAQLVLATPRQLHRHILRAHDRAWRWLWPRLDYLALPELHTYAGPPAAHLRWLLRRLTRLRTTTGAGDAPVLAASLAPISNAEQALAMFTDHGKLVHGRVRLMRLDDRPPHATLVALWRCGPDRAAELDRLAAELAAHQLQADVLDDAGVLRSGRPTAAAHVAIAPRVPHSAAERSTLLRSGYRLLVLLAGDDPHELYFADHADRLADSDIVFPDSSENPYIAAPQLCCSAAEQPLVDTELDGWGAVELRDRLSKRGALQPLPGELAWHATADAADPYEDLDPRAIGGEPFTVAWPEGRFHSIVPPLLLERVAHEGSVVAPGVRVRAVDNAARSVTIGTDATALGTVVAASSEVIVRDELAARPLKQFGVELTRGRVTITQRLLGLRDLTVDGTQRRVSIQPPHEMQWSAAACWLKLPVPEGTRLEDPATVGWSIAYAAPLLVLSTPRSLTAAYDEERRILYLVETEPGGTGVAAVCYELFERLLELAQNLCTACGRRPAWERLVESEKQVFAALAGAARSGATLSKQALPGNARVYSPGHGNSHPGTEDQAATPADGAIEAASKEPQAERRILHFPTRTLREAPADDRATAEHAPRQRAAVYDTPQHVAAASADPAHDGPSMEAPAGQELATQGLLEELLGRPSAPLPRHALEAAPPSEHPQTANVRQPKQPPVDTPSPGDEQAPAAANLPSGQNTAGGDSKPDVQALIERMRRLREEREAQQRAAQARQAELAARLLPPIEPDGVEPRFHIGQRVQCLPYGTGIVRSSRRADERELVLIDFADYGEIEVDSSVSLLRMLDDPELPEDE